MLLFACNEDYNKLELIRPHPDSKPGDRIYLEGDEEPDAPFFLLSGKKFSKISKKSFGEFKTDEEGVCKW